jgi:hypothetical protein
MHVRCGLFKAAVADSGRISARLMNKVLASVSFGGMDKPP